MSNQILNPLIQSETSDTLYYASSSLAYIWESINDLQLGEVSQDAQQGLCSLIQCVSQALDFEAYRVDSDNDSPKLHDALNPLEKELIKGLCKHIKNGDAGNNGPTVLPSPSKRRDN